MFICAILVLDYLQDDLESLLVMDIQTRIGELKTNILADIQKAVTLGDAPTIITKSRFLEVCDTLTRKYAELDAEVRELEKALSFYQKDDAPTNVVQPTPRILFQSSPEPDEREGSRKESLEKARVYRSNLVEELGKDYGIRLRASSKTVYETDDGRIVGMAFATERQPNKWFLGLPLIEYFSIVLICEKNSGPVKRFIFPRSFCAKYMPRLSKSKDDDQVKFNVYYKNGQYQFIIPQSDPLVINEYLDRFDAFQE